MAGPTPRFRWKRWILIGGAVAVLAVVGGPFAYIHFIEGKAPAPLSLSATATTSDPPTASAAAATTKGDGMWKIDSRSAVAYRVNEDIFAQTHAAAAQTGQSTGSITQDGTN